jgi:hypothetical protein
MIGTPPAAPPPHRVGDRRQLRHADARHDPGRADRAGPDADLDRVDAGLDQRHRRGAGGDVAGHQLQLREVLAGRAHRLDHPGRVAVGGVDADDVAAGRDQGVDPGLAIAADADRGAAAQPAQLVLGRQRVSLGLLDVLDRDQALEAAVLVDHQQLLDAVLVQQLLGRLEPDVVPHRDELLGHHVGDALGQVALEPHVAVGQDADRRALVGVDDRQAADVVAGASTPARPRAAGPGRSSRGRRRSRSPPS